MCGFGIQLEKRPHRFDLLRQTNPKEWEFWMYEQGWGHVLDYIGIKWEDEIENLDHSQITFDSLENANAEYPQKTKNFEKRFL